MELTAVVLVVLAMAHGSQAYGAGRAFPVHSENFIIEEFRTVNPEIEWDPTNYLVDVSGEFAVCEDIRAGYEGTRRRTPTGQTIGVVLDFVEGSAVDAQSVNGYITGAVRRWMRTNQYRSTIEDADRFGCSVRPGCLRGRLTVAVIACLFSPGRYPSDQPRPIRPWPIIPTTPRIPRTTPPPQPIGGGQEGLAFTENQYDMAERITGQAWDASHYLENLSGFEITCAMLYSAIDWPFEKAIPMAWHDHNMAVLGLTGRSRNMGDTQDAMEIIMEHFKGIQQKSMVGCSVIPDCMVGRGDLGGEMWVVVACIYEEPGHLRSRLETERRNRSRLRPRLRYYQTAE